MAKGKNPNIKVVFFYQGIKCRLRLTSHAADMFSSRKENDASLLKNMRRVAEFLEKITAPLPQVGESWAVCINKEEYLFFTFSPWNDGREFFLETYLWAPKRKVYVRPGDKIIEVGENDEKESV